MNADAAFGWVRRRRREGVGRGKGKGQGRGRGRDGGVALDLLTVI